MNQIEYSIVIPCYSSGEWLEELVERIAKIMTDLGSFELILVNDRSPDAKTWEEIEKLARKHEFIRGIDLVYNVGQFRATLCGLEYAQGMFIITMDDDMQHPPEEIPKLVQTMKENPSMDCIMGQFDCKQHSFLRNVGSRAMNIIMSYLYGKPAKLKTSSFRIFPAKIGKALTLYRIASPLLTPMLVSFSKNINTVTVNHEERKRGASGYSFLKCLSITFRSIVDSSLILLRLLSIIGFLSSAVAFFLVLYYWSRWFWGGIGVPGYTSLILTISFFCGMILAGLGIIGEYVGRIIREITGMPRYVVSQDTGSINNHAK